MPITFKSPEAATKELLTAFQVYLDCYNDGLTELFAQYQQQKQIPQIFREISELQAVKRCNDPKVIERLFNAESNSPVQFIVAYILESKKLIMKLAEHFDRTIPEDKSSQLIFLDEEDKIVITQQDLDNVLHFLEIMSKNKNTPLFCRPYFNTMPLTDEERKEVLCEQQKTRETVMNTLDAKLSSFLSLNDKSVFEDVVVNADASSAQTHHQILQRFQTNKKAIVALKKYIKTAYENSGISALGIENSNEENAFNRVFTEFVNLQNKTAKSHPDAFFQDSDQTTPRANNIPRSGK